MPQRHTDATLARVLREQGHAVNFPIPKPRKPRKNEESRMQQALVTWWAYACKTFGVPEPLLFAVPNAGFRSPVAGAIMKREGLRKGIPDLMLAVARHGMGGLFIELKTATGVLSPEQKAIIPALAREGYEVHVCRSTEEAMKIVGSYLTNK